MNCFFSMYIFFSFFSLSNLDYDENFANFLEKYENGDFQEIPEKELRKIFQNFESSLLEKMSTYDLINYFSANISSIIRSCKYKPINYRRMDNKSEEYLGPIDCTMIKAYVPSIYFGRKCFTYFSNLVDMSDDWRHIIPNTTTNCSTEKCSKMYTIDNLDDIYSKLYTRMIADFNPEILIEIEANDDVWKFMNIDSLFLFASM